MVGNGDQIFSQGYYAELIVQLQGHNITTNFYLLTLKDYDVVLGADWLRTIGPILWDFAKLTMEFQHEDPYKAFIPYYISVLILTRW